MTGLNAPQAEATSLPTPIRTSTTRSRASLAKASHKSGLAISSIPLGPCTSSKAQARKLKFIFLGIWGLGESERYMDRLTLIDGDMYHPWPKQRASNERPLVGGPTDPSRRKAANHMRSIQRVRY